MIPNCHPRGCPHRLLFYVRENHIKVGLHVIEVHRVPLMLPAILHRSPCGSDFLVHKRKVIYSSSFANLISFSKRTPASWMLVGWDKPLLSMTYWKYLWKTGLDSSSLPSNPSNLFSISMSLCGDIGTKQSLCPKSLGRKYIMSGTPDTVACLDFLIRWPFQYSFTLCRSVWSKSAKENQISSLCKSLVRSRMSDSWRSWKKSIHQLERCFL